MVPVAPIITAINFVFTLHIACTYIARFKNFSSSFLDHIFIFRNCNIYKRTCSFFIVTDCGIRCIVWGGWFCQFYIIIFVIIIQQILH